MEKNKRGVCPHCDGAGTDPEKGTKCPDCNGSGWIEIYSNLTGA